MKKSNLLLGALLGLGLANATAQEVTIDGLIRPRFEYRNGFSSPIAKDSEPAAFVSQRSSLLVKYTSDKYTAFFDLQDASVWGDRQQLSSTTGESFRVNQAWAKINLGKGWSTKLGRQIISYDDQRILGGLGWAQQQRTHDAGLISYTKEGLKIDAGFSFNQNGEGSVGNVFTSPNLDNAPGGPVFRYKAMQYLHLNNKFSDEFSGSFLFINNSFQDYIGGAASGTSGEGTNSRQTTGVYLKYKSGAFGASSSLYSQFGNIISDDIDMSGFLGALDLTYKPGKTLFGLGYEYISGDDNGASDGEIKSFFPLFGTNHKFNGFMDFFYVGNHANSTGLQDINAKVVLKTGEKSSLLIKGHQFLAANQVDGLSSTFGTEIDLVYTQKIVPGALIKLGYSQAFLDDDFISSRGVNPDDADDIQNWGWAMLVIKPNLFKWKKEAAEAK